MLRAVNIQSPINWNNPLNKGLRHWWMCLPDQKLGNRFRDLTRRKDATITGATPQAARGRLGGSGCFSYDGINDAALTAAIDLSAVDKMTLSFWLYKVSYPGANSAMLETSTTSTTTSNIAALLINPDEAASGGFAVRIRVSTAASGYNQYWFTRPSTGVWHYYVICMNRGGGAQQVTAVYVDGVSQTLTAIHNITDGTGGFGNYVWNFMARNNGASLPCNSLLDDVRVYDRLLSEPQARHLFRASRNWYPTQLNWLDDMVLAAEQAAGAPATSPYYYRHRRRVA